MKSAMKKIGVLLLAAAAVSFTACEPNKTEASQSATGSPIEEASATDQAETTTTITDSTAALPPDTTAL